MFEGLEKGWTEDQRRASDKAFLALSVSTLVFVIVMLVFEPVALQSHYRVFDVILGLALIAVNARTPLKWMKAKRRRAN